MNVDQFINILSIAMEVLIVIILAVGAFELVTRKRKQE